MLEGMAGIETLLAELPAERLVFGSYAPVFYFESAKLKLHESDLDEKQLKAISRENAERWAMS
jgi:predicted TIM-barrel fold metal-dependent hydrolase